MTVEEWLRNEDIGRRKHRLYRMEFFAGAPLACHEPVEWPTPPVAVVEVRGRPPRSMPTSVG